ncbi:MAG: phage terminase large subunit family protein [Nitrososphaerales archaeon]
MFQEARCPDCEAFEKEHPVVHEVIVAGEDLAKHRDYSAYISLKIDTQAKVARIQRIYQWPHVDYAIVQADTVNFYKEDNARVIGVDKGAAGEPVIETYKAMGIKAEPIAFTVQSKDEMINFVRALLQRARSKSAPYLELPRSGKFVEELKVQIKEQERITSSLNYPKYDSPQGAHDDLLWTLCIACKMSVQYLANPYWATQIRR